jgi:pyruvate kinase
VIRTRRTRIVATLGPASGSAGQVLALARAGADVFRINFSHGRHEEHAARIAHVRAAEAEIGRPLAVLADLQGPKFRLGEFKGGSARLGVGQRFRLDLDPAPGDATRVSVPHPEVFAALRPGAEILLDDGRARLRVTEAQADGCVTEAVSDATLSDHKGLNLPGLTVPVAALTEKDREDLAFALGQGVDWVALSFVQRASDMAALREIVQGQAGVLAKIEKPAALEALEGILELCDAVMVARGDLGVELSVEDVPVVQKQLVRAARGRGIPVIVATQMLESMVHAPAPTRAEASDVAGAVYEGADAVMLSAETAAGEYPLQAVSVMDTIIGRVERDPRWHELMRAEAVAPAEAMVAAARQAAQGDATACLVTFAATGGTARRLAQGRASQPILVLTTQLAVARRLVLTWGVEPRVIAEEPEDEAALTQVAVDEATSSGLAEKGERIVLLAHVPIGTRGAANFLRIVG